MTAAPQIELVGLSSCDTCRACRKALEGRRAEVVFRDVRRQPPTYEELSAWLGIFGATLVNRRSTTWRELSDTEKSQPALDLLLAHPALMKRPILRMNDVTYLGCSDATLDALAPSAG